MYIVGEIFTVVVIATFDVKLFSSFCLLF